MVSIVVPDGSNTAAELGSAVWSPGNGTAVPGSTTCIFQPRLLCV